MSAIAAAPLQRGAAALGLPLTVEQLARFEILVRELLRWNKAYNLTAITRPAEIVTHHLLDSLSALPELCGTTVADVGTGAGFPGLPLAIVDPGRQFTLMDAVDKKLRFIDHVVRELALGNVRTLHGRVEQISPARPFDTVITRAFAPLPRLLELVGPLADMRTRVIAMKGRWPEVTREGKRDEDAVDAGSTHMGSTHAGSGGAGLAGAGAAAHGAWRIESARRIAIPGLHEERHLVVLRRDAPPAIP